MLTVTRRRPACETGGRTETNTSLGRKGCWCRLRVRVRVRVQSRRRSGETRQRLQRPTLGVGEGAQQTRAPSRVILSSWRDTSDEIRIRSRAGRKNEYVWHGPVESRNFNRTKNTIKVSTSNKLSSLTLLRMHPLLTSPRRIAPPATLVNGSLEANSSQATKCGVAWCASKPFRPSYFSKKWKVSRYFRRAVEDLLRAHHWRG